MLGLGGCHLSLSKDVLFQPRMVSQFFHGNSLLRTDFQTLLQNINAGLSYTLFYKWLDLKVSCFDSFDSFIAVVAFEWKMTMKHAVKNDSTCPNVYSTIDFIVLLVGKTLRSHVGKTTNIQIFLCEVTNSSSDTKVNDLNLLLLRVNKKDILKLKIPVYQVILMTVPHAFHDLPEKYLRSFLI